jgi:hypothetical protein
MRVGEEAAFDRFKLQERYAGWMAEAIPAEMTMQLSKRGSCNGSEHQAGIFMASRTPIVILAKELEG